MKKAVICFTRVPRAGVTKTRLLPVLKGEQCAGLHRAILKDLASIYEQTDADLFVAYTPDPLWENLKDIFPAATTFFPQVGADLGEKMFHAMEYVLNRGYDACVLTGSDIPQMTPAHLESGFSALEKGDVAIGATSDGGYYLIGMKRAHTAPFQIHGYGGASVFENTIAAICSAGLTAVEALTCDDVDTPEDLRHLVCRADPDSHTGRFLISLRKAGVLL